MPPLEEEQARETLADRVRALGHDPVALITLAIHSRSFRRPQSTEEAFAGPSNPDSPQRQPLTPTLTVWGSVITAPLIELTSRIIWGHLNQVTYQHPPAYNMFGENSPNPTL